MDRRAVGKPSELRRARTASPDKPADPKGDIKMVKHGEVFGLYKVPEELEREFNGDSLYCVLDEIDRLTRIEFDYPTEHDRELILRVKDEDDRGRVAGLIGLLFNLLELAHAGDIERTFTFRTRKTIKDRQRGE